MAKGTTSGSERRRRTAILRVRLTPEEDAYLEGVARRRRMSAAALVRDLLQGRPLVEPMPRDLILAIGAIGSNVNQIGRAVNRAAKLDQIDRDTIRQDLDRLILLVEDVRNEWRKAEAPTGENMLGGEKK